MINVRFWSKGLAQCGFMINVRFLRGISLIWFWAGIRMAKDVTNSWRDHKRLFGDFFRIALALVSILIELPVHNTSNFSCLNVSILK